MANGSIIEMEFIWNLSWNKYTNLSIIFNEKQKQIVKDLNSATTNDQLTNKLLQHLLLK